MSRIALTDFTIRNLPTPSKGQQLDFWDITLRTFGVRCSYGGSKTFVLKQGNRRQVLGKVGIITLKQAREEARKRLAIKYLPQLNSIGIHQARDQYLAFKRPVLRETTYKKQVHHLRDLPNKNIQLLSIADIDHILKARSPPSARNTVNRHWMPTPIGAQFRPHLTTRPLLVAEAVAAQRSGAA